MKRNDTKTLFLLYTLAALVLLVAGVPCAAARDHDTGHFVFLKTAREHADFTRVTLPLYRGTSITQATERFRSRATQFEDH